MNSQLQKLTAAKEAGAGQLADAKEKLADAKEKALSHDMAPTLRKVADHFDGLKRILSILEDAMDTLEEKKDEVVGELSSKMMMANNAAGHAAASTAEAGKMADTLSAAAGPQLDEMIANAVAQHLCAGGENVSKETLTRRRAT